MLSLADDFTQFAAYAQKFGEHAQSESTMTVVISFILSPLCLRLFSLMSLFYLCTQLRRSAGISHPCAYAQCWHVHR